MLEKLRQFNFGYGKSSGVLETWLVTMFLWSPNMLLIFVNLPSIMALYSLIVTFLLVSVLVHKRYKLENGKKED